MSRERQILQICTGHCLFRLEGDHFKRKIVFQPSLFRGHVNSRGCTWKLQNILWNLLVDIFSMLPVDITSLLSPQECTVKTAETQWRGIFQEVGGWVTWRFIPVGLVGRATSIYDQGHGWKCLTTPSFGNLRTGMIKQVALLPPTTFKWSPDFYGTGWNLGWKPPGPRMQLWQIKVYN